MKLLFQHTVRSPNKGITKFRETEYRGVPQMFPKWPLKKWKHLGKLFPNVSVLETFWKNGRIVSIWQVRSEIKAFVQNNFRSLFGTVK